MRTIIHRSVKGIVIIAASLLMLSDSPIRLHAEPSFVAPDKGGAEGRRNRLRQRAMTLRSARQRERKCLNSYTFRNSRTPVMPT
jgi:hypothetical protein